jgi:DNA (cytosine-5)-methyltransferase 1
MGLVNPRFISLFTGIALHDLGLVRSGWQVAAQCETDPWCRAVLDQRFPGVPRWGDIRDVDEESVQSVGSVQLVTGGFPCPDISCAGRGVGLLRGERSSLWLAMLRIIRLARPAFVLAENVPALRTRGIDSVLHGLEEEGYAAWPLVVGAWALGAPQRRERVWIVGVAHGDGGALRL